MLIHLPLRLPPLPIPIRSAVNYQEVRGARTLLVRARPHGFRSQVAPALQKRSL